MTKVNDDSSSFLKKFLAAYSYRYDYKSDSLIGHDGPVEFSHVISQLRVYALNSGGLQYKNYFRDLLACWKKDESLKCLHEFREKIRHLKSRPDLVSSFLEAVSDQRTDLDAIVLRHWIWQVKRKLFGLEIDHHIMPVLFGKSGAGKSVAIRSLIEPLHDFTLSVDMSILSDQFSKRQFTRNYIVFFDELDGAESTDINRIKQIITAENMEYRVMRTEGYFYGRQNSSFIGCSNSPIRDRISDPTSARRFWQITTKDKIDWNTINTLDYQSLWQSVDENSPAPIVSRLDKVTAIQEEEIRTTTIIEEWLKMSYVLDESSKCNLRTSDLFENFKEWKEWQSITFPISFQKFARELKYEAKKVYGKDIAPSHSWNGTAWPLKLIEEKRKAG